MTTSVEAKTKKETKVAPKAKATEIKKVVVKKEVAPRAPKASLGEGKYVEAVGRRKTSVARVRLYVGKTGVNVNDKGYEDYFVVPRHRKAVVAPLDVASLGEKVAVSAKVVGGGIASQAEAVRHGISRALLLINPESRKRLKVSGFLKRDPRMVERKKYGLKKARKSPQWAKR